MKAIFAQLDIDAAKRRDEAGLNIMVDPGVAAVRRHKAKVVRETLRSLANEPGCGDLFGLLAQSATDDALAKLGRLLK